MRKNRLIVTGLIAAISMFSLFGCGSEENGEPKTVTSVEMSTDVEETEQETTTEKENVGKFVPEEVCKNISINGELIEFPWTLNKLGEEYTYGKISNEVEGDNICGGYLQCNGENFILVNIGEEEIDRDSPIIVMSFSVSDNISVYNLGRETTKEDVIEILGEPTEIRDDEVLDGYYVYLSDEMLLNFSFYEGKLVTTHINVYGDWK